MLHNTKEVGARACSWALSDDLKKVAAGKSSEEASSAIYLLTVRRAQSVDMIDESN